MFVNPIVGLNTIIGDAIAGGNWNGLLTSFDANDLSAHYNARLAANENMLQPGSAGQCEISTNKSTSDSSTKGRPTM